MTRKILNSSVILLLLFFTSYLFADSQPFPGLKTIQVSRLFSIAEKYEPMNIRVHYDPSLTAIINKPYKCDNCFEKIEILTTKIDRKSNENYTVFYSPGLSADPSFSIFITGTNDAVGRISGLEIFIPGNGAVYVMGHTNNYFNKHRKYILVSGKLVERKQSYYFVGLESNAKREIALFSDKMEKEIVATVPSGGKLTVILNDGENFYLIKTSFGLLGWVRYQSEYADNFIEGLFFKGD